MSEFLAKQEFISRVIPGCEYAKAQNQMVLPLTLMFADLIAAHDRPFVYVGDAQNNIRTSLFVP